MLIYSSLYLLLFIILLLVITFTTIFGRRKGRVPYGLQAQSGPFRPAIAHSNFVAYVPFILLLMVLLELQEGSLWIIHVAGVLALMGRVVHFYGICFAEARAKPNFTYRVRGMQLTILPIVLLSIALTIKLVALL